MTTDDLQADLAKVTSLLKTAETLHDNGMHNEANQTLIVSQEILRRTVSMPKKELLTEVSDCSDPEVSCCGGNCHGK